MRTSCIILAGWVVTALAVPAAWGQGRGTLRPTRPGSLSRPGSETSSYKLRRYSGAGSLALPSIGADQGLLRSSIGRPSAFDLRRGGGAAPGMPGGLESLDLPAAQGRRMYQPAMPSLDRPADLDGTGMGTGGELFGAFAQPAAVGAAQSFLDAVAASSVLEAGDDVAPISSLVPERKSLYQKELAAGEQAFRRGEFGRAMDRFRTAIDMGPDKPEALLSAMHARFALSTIAFAEAASYLQRAVRYFPELPLAPLRPREFFGSQVTYVEKMQALEQHLEDVPRDAAAQFVYGYFQWFDGDEAAARSALKAAARYASDPDFAEAVETFWRGMAARGAASGPVDVTPEADREMPAGAKDDAAERPEARTQPTAPGPTAGRGRGISTETIVP